MLKDSAEHLHAEEERFEDLAILLPIDCAELFPISQSHQGQYLIEVDKQLILIPLFY